MASKKYWELGGEILERQQPSRKKVKEGDIFVVKVKDRDYYFGRVISTKARQYLDQGNKLFLLYLYDSHSNDKNNIPELKKENLLIPPYYGMIQDWTNGCVETVGHKPLTEDDVFTTHYMYSPIFKVYLDGFGNKVDPPPSNNKIPVGSDGLGSFASLDIEIRKALNIELPEWAE